MQRLQAIVLIIFVGAALPLFVEAQTTESYTFATNRVVPDGTAAGLADVHTLNSSIGTIKSVNVRLKIAGEFNGDLYGYVRHFNGFTVLLNRPGKIASGNDPGYPDSGFNVTFQSGAANGDIHMYHRVVDPAPGSPLTGFWMPDGCAADPTNVTDVSVSSTSLTNFNGLNASGLWTLYLADLESGGVNMLTEWGLDITGVASPSFASSNPPVLSAIPNAVVRPGFPLEFIVSALDPNGDELTFSLDPGAPAGSFITNCPNSTNADFFWLPTRAQASTTNFITVRATENSPPFLSSAASFVVSVEDYLELTVGSTNVSGSRTASIPFTLSSSDGVSNLVFTVQVPDTIFTNSSIAAIAPEIGSASITDQGSNLLIAIDASPGQMLHGTEQLAQMSFTAASNAPSSFVPFAVGTVTAAKPNGSAYVNYITHAGMVAMVQDAPLLTAAAEAGTGRSLTLYGLTGVNYQIQYATNLTSPVFWVPLINYFQTTGAVTITLPPANDSVFYRLVVP